MRRGVLVLRATCAVLILASAVGLFAQETEGHDSFISYRIDARIVVADPDAASITIADFADTNGGYFITRSRDLVELRIPNTDLGDLRSFVTQIADETVRFDPSSRDLRSQLIQIEAGITSRKEALEKIFAFLENADIPATLAFEQELRVINGELESLEGQRRRILNDIDFAFVSIALSSTESEIPAQLPSSFDWINTVDLYRFLREEGL